MSIVKYKNPKTGAVYAYELTKRWDPETQRNEPVRTHLGRVNPDTGEIIPADGKRGRKPRKSTENGEKATPSPGQYENAVQSLEQMQKMLNEQQVRISQLETENAAMKAALQSIADQTAVFVSRTASTANKRI